jgi:hypothetical protein
MGELYLINIIFSRICKNVMADIKDIGWRRNDGPMHAVFSEVLIKIYRIQVQYGLGITSDLEFADPPQRRRTIIAS